MQRRRRRTDVHARCDTAPLLGSSDPPNSPGRKSTIWIRRHCPGASDGCGAAAIWNEKGRGASSDRGGRPGPQDAASANCFGGLPLRVGGRPPVVHPNTLAEPAFSTVFGTVRKFGQYLSDGTGALEAGGHV